MIKTKFVGLLNHLKASRKEIKNFGLSYGLSYFFTGFLKSQKYKTRRKAINILDKEFGYIFKNNNKRGSSKENIGDLPKNIFFFWAQGFDNLPFIPKESLKRIKHFYPDYHIFLISLNNFEEYVSISPKILSLFSKKKISIQTFSDILRFNLLYKYGGCWCDATLMFFDRFPIGEQLEKNKFCSINHDSPEKSYYWGKVYPVTYTTFFMGSLKGSNIMKACVEFFDAFYNNYNFIIDYFMNDYALILCMKYHLDNDSLNHIPYNSGTPFYLYHQLKRKKVIDIEKCKLCPQKANWREESIFERMPRIDG